MLQGGGCMPRMKVLQGFRHKIKLLRLLCCIFMVAAVGCRLPGNGPESSETVMKSGPVGVTVIEFGEELELKLAAYPYSILQNCQEYNELVTSLVDQLSEEILLRRAVIEAGIALSPEDLEAEEARMRQDYPDQQFERMLLENAVSYPVWKRRLEIRLNIDKFLDTALSRQIEISGAEISRYYSRHQQEAGSDGNGDKKQTLTERELITLLRMEKAEALYPELIRSLGEKYQIEMDTARLQLFFKQCTAN